MIESILLQTPVSVTGSDPLVNLIMAISILISSITAIVSGIFVKIAQNTKGKTQENAQKIVHVAEFAGETAKQVVNNEDKIRGVATVVSALSPEEARKKLDEANITLEKLKQDVLYTTENLNKLAENLPIDVNIDANHNNIPDKLEPVIKKQPDSTLPK